MVRRLSRFFFETGKALIIALLVVVPLRLYVAQPFFVRGASMEPTFSNGDYLIIDELSYHFRDPRRGEVIVFRFPNDETQFFIKRIIALPGETMIGEEGKVSIERFGEILELTEPYVRAPIPDTFRKTAGPNEYFVLGDNRTASSDSRRWGVLPKDHIVGRVFLAVWPTDSFSVFANPVYE